ncbi:MAG: hypothetical protein KatS3mg115_1865 [Candidatus Poribacteria bacterium]|nr:MAG: hypothetical protein KatS3mg115_1865 [Candidatus Poribacteria bacterium]
MPSRFGRRMLIALGILLLVVGVLGGLGRVGWLPVGVWTGRIAAHHGALMVSGFLGALIGLERAVAWGRRWGYLAPILALVGSALLIGGAPRQWSAGVFLLSSALLGGLYARLYRRRPSLEMRVMGAGALCLLVAHGLWMLGFPYGQLVPWWMGFLVLTIAGERLELSRLLRLTRGAVVAFTLILLLAVAGYFLSVWNYGLGIRVEGAAYLLLSFWLLRYDMARRSVRQPGLSRYTALALLVGYGWLGVAGLIRLLWAGWPGQMAQDAALHAFFLGFVFSMIFAHAPIIFPSILGVSVAFGRFFYVPLVLLELTVALRVVGDLVVGFSGQRWGALLNALTLALFLETMAGSVIRGRRGTEAVREPVR